MKKTLLSVALTLSCASLQAYEISDVKEISSGKYKTFFTLDNGYLYTTNNAKKDSTTLSNLELISANVITSAVGTQHALKVSSEQELFVVGKNDFGQLGIPDTEAVSEWTAIQGLGKVVKVIAGNGVSYVINDNGDLFAAGWNYHGVIDSKKENITTFTKIAENIKDVAGSVMFISYLDKENNLHVKGHPQYGFQKFNEFTQIAENVSSIAGGHYHLMYVIDKELFGLGANHQGQLGKVVAKYNKDNWLANYTDQPTSLAKNIKDVFAGEYHSMYLTEDNKLFVTGNNGNGQLGLGNQTMTNNWTQVLENVEYVSAGSYHSVVIKNDKTLWISGNNAQGQLTFKSDKENTYFYGEEMKTNIESWSWRPIYFKNLTESFGDETK